MRKRRIVAAIASTALATGLGFGGASAAAAATYVVNACQQSGNYTLLVGDEVRTIIPASTGGQCSASITHDTYLAEFSGSDGSICFIWQAEAGAEFESTYGNITLTIREDDGPATLGQIAADGSACGWGSPAAPAIPMWQQAIGRASATATCPDGYTGSWDTWPNGGTGGYVCNRFVPFYGN